MNPNLDRWFDKAKKWQQEMKKLRAIVLSCGLKEELKWYQPCYTVDGRNVLVIHGFKEYCALLFFKGVLLKDPKGLLIRQTENVQSGRQIRFTGLQEIVKLGSVLKAYIKQAAEVEKAGLKVKMKKTEDFKVVIEFQKELVKNPGLKKAFSALTPGRQRGYLLYFGGAKQSQTRIARIEKYIPKILKVRGLQD